MALLSSDITVRLVNTELGSPFGATPNDITVKDVCAYASQNPFSFYGPWLLATDANKDAIISYGSNNYRLGDFRSYNHSAATPKAANNFTQNWGPGGTTVDMVIVSFPYDMNVLAADSNAQYMRYNAYLSTANRVAETSRYDQYTEAALFNSITPLTGHIRTQSQRIHSTHIGSFIGLSTVGLSTPNDLVYLDTFLSNSSGTRLLNLGSVAGGYTTITMHEQQQPYITAIGNITPPPSGWTAAWIAIHTSSSPVCGDTLNINQTFGGTTFDFYVKVLGIDGSDTKVRQVTDCDVYLTHDGGKQLVYSGALSHTAGTNITGTLSASNTWSYDEVGEVTIENVTFGAGETTC